VTIFENSGHSIVYKILPWNRAIKSTRAGKYHAVIGAAKKEVPDFIVPEKEIGAVKDTFFAKKREYMEIWRI